MKAHAEPASRSIVWLVVRDQRLGDRAMAGRSGPGVAQKAADFNQLGMQVNTETVLGIYASIAEEVTRLRLALRAFQNATQGGMPHLGGDPVSPYASTAFNQSTDKLVALAKRDIDDLDRVSQGLVEDAKSYGKTEQEIGAAFDPSKFRYVPAPVTPAVSDLPPALRGLVATPPWPPLDSPLGAVFGRDPR